MSPPYFFRIDEIKEHDDAPATIDNRADWVPSIVPGANVWVPGTGVTGRWWFCDGAQLSNATNNQLPQGSQYYQTYSIFFSDGYGYWVMKGDATRPDANAIWLPLRFDHDPDDDYSSYLCNVAEQRSLACRRQNQHWPQMLLPDIYCGTNVTPYQQYGALKGELGIFLGLIAFTMTAERLPAVLPAMFSNGAWQTYNMQHGREDGRGVVVYVYTCPPDYPLSRPEGRTGSSHNDLLTYENGHYYGGKYYH